MFSSISLLKQGQLSKVDQDHVQSGLEHFQGWVIHSVSEASIMSLVNKPHRHQAHHIKRRLKFKYFNNSCKWIAGKQSYMSRSISSVTFKMISFLFWQV